MATGLSVTACSTGPADLAVNSTDWKGVSGVLVTNVDHQRASGHVDMVKLPGQVFAS